jgi:hypothetical protein
LLEIVNQLVENKIKTADILKRAIGVVTELLEDGLKAKVKVNQNVLSFLNKSGEELTIGDEVEIHYWTNISNGYIAVKHGVPTPLGTSAKMNNAVITCTDTESFDFVNNLHTVLLTKDVLTGYTYQRGYIVVNGYAATYIPSATLRAIDTQTTYETFLNTIGTVYQYKQVVLFKYDTVHSSLSENYIRPITYSIELYDFKYDNGQFTYRICISVSDPYYTESNTVTDYSPQNYTYITSNEIVSDTISLDSASIILTFPDSYQQYPSGETTTIFTDSLHVDVELILKVGSDYYYKDRYSTQSWNWLVVTATDQAEIDYIKAKQVVTEKNVME